MLIVGFDKIGKSYLTSKYSDKINEVDFKEYKVLVVFKINILM